MTPGPGSYDPDPTKNTCKAPPQYSFGFKGLKDEPYNNPGPGAYDVLNETNTIKSRPTSKYSIYHYLNILYIELDQLNETDYIRQPIPQVLVVMIS